MNTIDVFGLALPLEVLLWLGIALLVAVCVLAGVMGYHASARRTSRRQPKLSPVSAKAKARAAAHVELDDFLADPEGYAGVES